MSLDARDARLRQHRVRAADPRRRPEEGVRDGQADRHHDQARLLPGRGPRRPTRGRDPARDGRRLRHAGLRRRPPPAHGHRARSCSPTARARSWASPKGKRVLTDGEAYEVTEDPREERAVRARARRANYGCPAAGKTGTTDEAKDAWFVGYTPELSAAGLGRLPQRAASRCRARRAAPTRRRSGTPSCSPRTASTATTSRSPTEPLQSSPFFGKYASTGAPARGSYYGCQRRRRRPTPPSTGAGARPALLRGGAASTTRPSTSRRRRRRPRRRRRRRPRPGTGDPGNGNGGTGGPSAAPTRQRLTGRGASSS